MTDQLHETINDLTKDSPKGLGGILHSFLDKGTQLFTLAIEGLQHELDLQIKRAQSCDDASEALLDKRRTLQYLDVLTFEEAAIYLAISEDNLSVLIDQNPFLGAQLLPELGYFGYRFKRYSLQNFLKGE
jgi:hypothetical protein